MGKYSPLRWGILGTGGIASAFVEDLKILADHKVVAVGSRSEETAKNFSKRYGIPNVHGSYEALVSDQEVDVVYVSTPHPYHHPNTLLALRAGKPVLVEKPFSMSAEEAIEMVALARSKNLFLLEAMWTKFLPHIQEIRTLLKDGVLGEVTTLFADHGQWFERDPHHRLFAPELGGGALLDLGIYPVSFAFFVLGKPERIVAVGDKAFTGVDAQTSMIFQYRSGAHALLTTTLSAATPNSASIGGTKARIEIDRTYYAPTSFTVTDLHGKVLQRYEKPYRGRGLREQAVEVARCLREGLKESPLMPLDETVEIMRTLDEVRRQIGLTYPKI